MVTLYTPHTSWPKQLTQPCVALGNFDGMHRGHQAVFDATKALAHTLGKAPILLTFEPHPRTFFTPHTPTFRLTDLSIKKALADLFHMRGIFVIPFTSELASMEAETFLAYLKEQLNPSGIVVGYDFHFGKGRTGTPNNLKKWAEDNAILMQTVPPLRITPAGERISSSLIRLRLSAGEIQGAADLLGYFWSVSGKVIHGAKRGRMLGYPTLNIALPKHCLLRYGAYVIRAQIKGEIYEGVASFGIRPTFSDSHAEPILEVHLLNAHLPDLYETLIMVEFLDWIHEEKKCSSSQALQALIAQDCHYAHDFFKSHTPQHLSLVMSLKNGRLPNALKVSTGTSKQES
jgi:riboflavin kinase/FMN adenylyltransferase